MTTLAVPDLAGRPSGSCDIGGGRRRKLPAAAEASQSSVVPPTVRTDEGDARSNRIWTFGDIFVVWGLAVGVSTLVRDANINDGMDFESILPAGRTFPAAG